MAPSDAEEFDRLAIEKQIADEHLQAARLNEDAVNWSMWAPWWPPPIVIVRQPVAPARR